MAGHEVIVVIAVDPSKQAEDAVEYYFDNLHRPANKLVLAHVIELPDSSHARQAYVSPSALADMWKDETEKAKGLDDKFCEIIKLKGVKEVKVRSEGGMKPGQVICSIAADEKASMIVIGTRGMGKVRRTLLGSVSDYVVHHSTCPVVVCRKAADQIENKE